MLQRLEWKIPDTILRLRTKEEKEHKPRLPRKEHLKLVISGGKSSDVATNLFTDVISGVCIMVVIDNTQISGEDAKKNSGFLKVFQYFCIGRKNLSCYYIVFLRY